MVFLGFRLFLFKVDDIVFVFGVVGRKIRVSVR